MNNVFFKVVFNLLDKTTVLRLKKRGDLNLPSKKLNIAKNKRWNTKWMNSELLQGLYKGESVGEIALRIFPEIANKSDYVPKKGGANEFYRRNENIAIRNARTMVTEAENGGRLQSYKDLSDEGIVMKKVWIATEDNRTRDSHLDVDGEEVDIDEEFSNECDCPGEGPPDEVWNCRCSMKTHILGFKNSDGSISYV